MMYRGRELSKFEEEIVQFIVRHEMLNKSKPFVYKISMAVDANDRAVVKALKKIYGEYPKKLIVTMRHKELFDSFEDGMTTTDLANKLGLTRNLIQNHRTELEYLGAKFGEHERTKERMVKKPPKKPKTREEKLIGIKVIHGIYKGKYGYLNNKLQAVIHIDGEPKAVEIESFDYVEIKC